MSDPRLVIAAASLILAACTNHALVRFRTEHQCPDATIRDLGASAFRVEGCGRAATYVCNRGVCVEEHLERSRAAMGGRTTRSASAGPTRLRLQEGQVAGSLAVRLVVPQLGGAALVYAPEVDRAHVIAQVPERAASRCRDVRVAADGTVRVATPRDQRGAFAWERESLDGIDRGVLVALLFCNRRLDVVGPELVVLRQFIARVRELAAGERSGREAASGSSSSPLADGATRAWLDASRDAILGCASRETVIVRVEAREGSTAVSLQPPLAGGPEEACVRSALGEAPATPDGVLIHAVR